VCVLCGQLTAELHWSETRSDAGTIGSAAGETARRRQRFARVRLLDQVLRHYGLGCRDEWSATSYVVADRKGRSELVPNLGELWPAAEALAGRPLDPLEPGLLERLEAGPDG
jgi:hypothetical protein